MEYLPVCSSKRENASLVCKARACKSRIIDTPVTLATSNNDVINVSRIFSFKKHLLKLKTLGLDFDLSERVNTPPHLPIDGKRGDKFPISQVEVDQGGGFFEIFDLHYPILS
jgi:hypothetical protein